MATNNSNETTIRKTTESLTDATIAVGPKQQLQAMTSPTIDEATFRKIRNILTVGVSAMCISGGYLLQDYMRTTTEKVMEMGSMEEAVYYIMIGVLAGGLLAVGIAGGYLVKGLRLGSGEVMTNVDAVKKGVDGQVDTVGEGGEVRGEVTKAGIGFPEINGIPPFPPLPSPSGSEDGVHGGEDGSGTANVDNTATPNVDKPAPPNENNTATPNENENKSTNTQISTLPTSPSLPLTTTTTTITISPINPSDPHADALSRLTVLQRLLLDTLDDEPRGDVLEEMKILRGEGDGSAGMGDEEFLALVGFAVKGE